LWTVSRAIQAVQDAHPQTPHYYLQVLGVDPMHQGKGWSRPLLQIILARADQEQMPVYLETAEESNLSLYRRYGFEVSKILTDLPGEAPPLWCMWREPDRAGAM
jgi:ribosomal protein S18 acetylase RimI-like enzyme